MGSLIFVKRKLRNKLYYLVWNVVIGKAAFAIGKNDVENIMTWHLRLGLVSERRLIEMDKKGLFQGGLKGKLKFCNECVYGKSSRIKFNISVHTTMERLAYIHYDLWGPSRVKTIGGAGYFISIIDDYSRKVWVFLMKSKDETFISFITLKKLFEK
uniref:GAG-pre-integrase domain-containing protein n=1 Tax=Cannabis sativa TaxID=3483 RepID=A0A803P917_CANSA